MQDAVDFWQRLKVLPPDADIEDRANQLGAVACVEGVLAAVTSISVEECKPVRERFGFYRVLVDPVFRGQDLVPPLVDTSWRLQATRRQPTRSAFAGSITSCLNNGPIDW